MNKNKNIKTVIVGFPPFEFNQGMPVLSQSRQFQWFNNPSYIYPVIPALAATELKRHNYKVYFIDAIASNISMLDWFDKIDEILPDLIFFEVKTPVIYYIWDIVNSIKDRYPDMYVVLGGDHVSAMPDETFKFSKTDYVITGGDFDYLLLNLVEYLNGKVKLDKGIYYIENGEVKNTGMSELKTDMDSSPFIDRDLTKWRYYAKENGNFKYFPATYIMSARDCMYNKCTHCSWASNLFHNYKLRSPENVVDEIEFLYKRYGIREVMDDTSCFPAGQWLSLFAKLLIDRKLNKKVHIGCNMCIPSLTFGEYKLMKKAGVRFILFELLSANQKTLDKLEKNISVNDIIESIKMAHKAGLEPHVTINIGYPWENEDNIKTTYNIIKSLMLKGYIHTMQASIVIPYPGTKLFDYCKSEGLLNTENWALYDMRKGVIKTEISDKKLKEYVSAFYNIAFNPIFIMRRILSIRSIHDIKYFVKAFRKIFLGHLLDFK